MLYCYFFIQISSFIVKLCIVTDYNLQIYSYCSIPVHIQMSPVGMKCPYSFHQHARDSAHSPLEHAEIDVFMFDGRELWVLTFLSWGAAAIRGEMALRSQKRPGEGPRACCTCQNWESEM